jgi:acetyl esterase/lipase
MTDAASPSTSYAFDPELAEFARSAVTPEIVDAATARAEAEGWMALLAGDVDTSALTIDDRTVPGPAGAPEVPVRVYAPRARSGLGPGVLYIHGGGFFSGSVAAEHPNSTAIARELGVVVVSVEYRLAPEHPFPAPLEDCYAALVWLHEHASDLGVDPARIAVAGSSAGGGLAAGLALLARDRGGPALCFQYLGIPELDDRLDTPSMLRFTDTPLWARPAAIQSWRFYLGETDDVSPYAAPARAEDLAGLPPAYVTTMEFDPLRDEGISYGLRMLQAGVSVELHSFPGTFHGSSLVTDAAVTKREAAERMTALRRGLGLTP